MPRTFLFVFLAPLQFPSPQPFHPTPSQLHYPYTIQAATPSSSSCIVVVHNNLLLFLQTFLVGRQSIGSLRDRSLCFSLCFCFWVCFMVLRTATLSLSLFLFFRHSCTIPTSRSSQSVSLLFTFVFFTILYHTYMILSALHRPPTVHAIDDSRLYCTSACKRWTGVQSDAPVFCFLFLFRPLDFKLFINEWYAMQIYWHVKSQAIRMF